MRINALLSGFAPAAFRGGGDFLAPSGGGQASAGQGPVSADIFARRQAGEAWAGSARTAVTGGRPCACKRCPACAAQAYAAQAGRQEEVPGPGAAAAAEEKEETAAASGGGGTNPAMGRQGRPEAEPQGTGPAQESPPAAAGPKGAAGEPLTRAEQLRVAELAVIDAKVRAHEMAHLAAAGVHATGGISFQYAKGPDGKRYAVAGEVGIDTGKEATPEATISKMRTVRAAALAPADPSPQDRKVAARAALAIAEAGQELRLIRLEQAKGEAGGPATGVEAGGKRAVAGEQPGSERASGQPSPAPGQKAAAAVAGLLRPASRIHLVA